MNLYEFEGKALLAHFGVATPKSSLLRFADAQAPLDFPFMLKAQVLTGGRGKAGGIKACSSEGEYAAFMRELFAMKIKGLPVYAVLCEQMLRVEREFYLAITLQGVQRPTLIASRAGGMDIEEVARTAPEKILKLEIDPFTGLKSYQMKYIATFLGIEEREAADTLLKVQRAFFETNALLVEVNPLGMADGKLIAIDSKFVLDDDALGGEFIAQIIADRGAFPEPDAAIKEQTTITFVPIGDGSVGLISDGAGTGMLALDMVTDAGGKVSSFCELGGTTNEEVMYRAMQLTLECGLKMNSLLIVLIGGFNRMDDMAKGIIGYMRTHEIDVPVFTRMCGTMEAEGKKLMADAGLNTFDDLAATVLCAVQGVSGV